MSFLDTICCAFGAIVLIYMIINAAGARSFQRDTHDLRAEVDRLEEEVLDGYKELPDIVRTSGGWNRPYQLVDITGKLPSLK